MVTMDRIDQFMREAEQTQDEELAHLDDSGALAITGVQLNEASKMVTIYHRETGEPRLLPRLAAQMALRKKYRRPGDPLHGQFIFAARPTKPYHLGECKCELHPDNPERAKYDVWGLPVCTAAHLASPGEVRRHMEKRHPSADKIIREEMDKSKQDRQLESQNALGQAILEAMKQMAGQSAPQPIEVPTATEAVDEIVDIGNDIQAATTVTRGPLQEEIAPLYVSDKPPHLKPQRRRRRKTNN